MISKKIKLIEKVLKKLSDRSIDAEKFFLENEKNKSCSDEKLEKYQLVYAEIIKDMKKKYMKNLKLYVLLKKKIIVNY